MKKLSKKLGQRIRRFRLQDLKVTLKWPSPLPIVTNKDFQEAINQMQLRVPAALHIKLLVDSGHTKMKFVPKYYGPSILERRR